MTQYTNPATYYNAIAAMSAEINQLKNGQFTINRKINELSNHHDENIIVKEFCFGGPNSTQTIAGVKIEDGAPKNGTPTVFIPKATGEEGVIGYLLGYDESSNTAKTITINSLSFKVERVGNEFGKLEGVPADKYILNDITSPEIISRVSSRGIFCIPKNTAFTPYAKYKITEKGEIEYDSTYTSPKTYTTASNIVVKQYTEEWEIEISSSGNYATQTVKVLREVTLPEIGLPDVSIIQDNSLPSGSEWKSIYRPLKVYGSNYYISTDFTTQAMARSADGDIVHAAGYIMEPVIDGDVYYVRTAVIGGIYEEGAVWYPPTE